MSFKQVIALISSKSLVDTKISCHIGSLHRNELSELEEKMYRVLCFPPTILDITDACNWGKFFSPFANQREKEAFLTLCDFK